MKLQESQTIEFKEVWRDEYLKTVCAFANTDGGVFYIGLTKPHDSFPRNPLIAEMFFRAGYIEAWGRGTITIIEETKRSGLNLPTFNFRHGGLEVIFERNPMLFSENGVGEVAGDIVNDIKDGANDAYDGINSAKATINGADDTVNDTVNVSNDTVNGGKDPVNGADATINDDKDTVKDTVNVSLTENQRLILEMISQNQHTTSEEISKNVGVNLRNTKKNLAALKANGLIERVGADKNGYWRVLK